MPLTQALRYLGEKNLLPTDWGTDELRTLAADVRAKALFSARNTNRGILETIQDQIGGLLKGEFNEATARMKVQQAIQSTGYSAEFGFPGDEGKGIPPAEEGSLRDLASDERIRLVLETNYRQAANFALREQGNDDLGRFLFPAWELVRLYVRRVPRGEMPGSLGWDERFVRAGGSLIEGRMIALKDDDVWENLGDSDQFEDGLDSSFPPYAFNSGMAWQEVPRAECVSLGLISGEEVPAKSDGRFFDEDSINDKVFAPGELAELVKGLRV